MRANPPPCIFWQHAGTCALCKPCVKFSKMSWQLGVAGLWRESNSWDSPWLYLFYWARLTFMCHSKIWSLSACGPAVTMRSSCSCAPGPTGHVWSSRLDSGWCSCRLTAITFAWCLEGYSQYRCLHVQTMFCLLLTSRYPPLSWRLPRQHLPT